MNVIFLFLLKAAVINALMIGFYHFAIRPGRNFRLMRAVLLLAIALPLLLPLIPQPLFQKENSAVPVYVFSLPEVTTTVVIAQEETLNWLPLLQNVLYLSVAIFLMLGTVISVISVIRKYLKTTETLTPLGKVLIDNTAKSPYSFFRWVFFSEEGLTHPAADWLLRHEFSHVERGHSFDRMLSAIFRSFFWFSPFAHINNRLLAEVHEFQADADAIEAIGDKTSYSKLLAGFTDLHDRYQISNPFSAHLKKRMIMLNNLKPGKFSITRILAGLVIITGVALFSSMVRPGISGDNNSFIPKDLKTGEDTSMIKMEIVYDSPDQKLDTKTFGSLPMAPPVFPGGDEARTAFFHKNINYPTDAIKKNIQGTVLYRVIIDKYGKVTEPIIEKGIGNGCDEEVLRVVKMMPDWKPGIVNGEPVKVAMIIPVTYSLSDDKDRMKSDERYVFKPIPDEIQEADPDTQNDPSKKKNDPKEEVFTVVEIQPQFPGGDDARIAYMQKVISYPEQAKKDKVEGTVFVTFVVETDGHISNAKVLRGIGGGCDEVALKAIQNMPPWLPGKQKGKPVKVQFNMPVKFSLDNSKEPKVKTSEVSIIRGGREVYNIVDTPPVFPGGMDALLTYIRKKTGRPNLVNKQIDSPVANASVYLSFIIEPDGEVTPEAVAIPAGEAPDNNFSQAVKDMPHWQPGSNKGKFVPVMIRLFLTDEKAN